MVGLPRGTVTLLFTDIEGSTRLLQELGSDRYVRALEDHRRLVRQAMSQNGGVAARETAPFAAPSTKPSSGLEPETPSLPWT